MFPMGEMREMPRYVEKCLKWSAGFWYVKGIVAVLYAVDVGREANAVGPATPLLCQFQPRTQPRRSIIHHSERPQQKTHSNRFGNSFHLKKKPKKNQNHRQTKNNNDKIWKEKFAFFEIWMRYQRSIWILLALTYLFQLALISTV